MHCVHSVCTRAGQRATCFAPRLPHTCYDQCYESTTDSTTVLNTTRLWQLLFLRLAPPRSSLLSVQPSAPAVTDSVQAPEVQQPEARPPRCSSRPPLSIQPKGRKGLREDTRGPDAVAAGPRRAPCRSAGSCRAEHLSIASADIVGSGKERSQDR